MMFTPNSKLVFLTGFLIGCILAVLLLKTEKQISKSMPVVTNFKSHKLGYRHYNTWLTNKGVTKKEPVDYDQLSYDNKQNLNIFTEAQFLMQHVLVLCVVFVRKIKNAEAIKNTWGRHCNDILFFGLEQHDKLPVIQLRPKSSWHFLCDSIRFLWKKHKHKLQWTLFVSDDIFAIPENLRYYVATLDYNNSYYFGHTLLFWNELYNIGQAGYVLSRGSIASLASNFNTTEACLNSGKYWRNEDYYLGKHLARLGIIPEDTRTIDGRGRFHGYNFNQLLFPGKISLLSSYYKKSIYPVPEGPECCSKYSVTFHGTEADKIYLYNYIIYRLKVLKHGGHLGNRPAPTPYPEEEVWKQFIREEGLGDADLSAKEFYDLWIKKISAPDKFNEKLRDESLKGAISDISSGLANMTEVLHSIFTSLQANITDNII